jgi:transposase-like protein
MSIVAGSNKGRRPYPPPSKRDAVELYRRRGQSIVTIAGEIGVAPEAADSHARAPLRMERDLLKRAAAFFAKETETR